MKEKLKYFIINKAFDYNRGLFENMKINGSALCFNSERNTGVGRFMTRIFDSGERETRWHRLVIHTENCAAEDLKVTVYSADDIRLRFRDEELTIFELFGDSRYSLTEKLDAYKPFVVKQTSGVSDILLHDVSGRYLWLLIEQYSSGETAAIQDVRIFLPSYSWIDHLPGIYRRGDSDTHFLERYLGIFQTLYEELNDEITDMSYRFDPESADRDFLKWLAGWLNITDTCIWNEEQLRKLLKNAVRLYRMRGTKESLSEIIELYTGEKPFIIEGFEIRELAATVPNGKALLEMYGEDPWKVTVLVRPGYDTEIIRRIASEMLPVTSELNLVELDPYIFLDNYAYLGVNSSLGYYRPAVLDGSSQLMLSVLGGEENGGSLPNNE